LEEKSRKAAAPYRLVPPLCGYFHFATLCGYQPATASRLIRSLGLLAKPYNV
jgi:hypothetical protein